MKLVIFGASNRCLTHLKNMKQIVADINIVGIYNYDSFCNMMDNIRDLGIPTDDILCTNSEDEIRDIIAKHKPDLTLVCSLNSAHMTHIDIAMKSGSDVFCEKPLCIIRSDIEKLARIEFETGRKLFTGFVLRYAPVFEYVKKIIAGDIDFNGVKAGTIMDIRATDDTWTGLGMFNNYGWRANADLTGGFLCEKLIHTIDIINMLMMISNNGIPPINMMCHQSCTFFKEENSQYNSEQENGTQYIPDMNEASTFNGSPDTFLGMITYYGGQTISIAGSKSAVRSGRFISIRCYNMTIVINFGNYMNPTCDVYTRGFTRGNINDQELKFTTTFPSSGCHGNGDSVIMQNIINCVINNEPYKIDLQEVLISNTIAIMMQESANDNAQWINPEPFWKKIGCSVRTQDNGYTHTHDDGTTEFLHSHDIVGYDPSQSTIHNFWPDFMSSRIGCSFVLAFDANNSLVLSIHNDPARGADIPGGHVELGDTVTKTAVKEFHEETGISITEEDLIPCGKDAFIKPSKISALFKEKWKKSMIFNFYCMRLDYVVDPKICIPTDPKHSGIILVPLETIFEYANCMAHKVFILAALDKLEIKK